MENTEKNIIALAQLNSIVGNVEHNKNMAIEYIKKAKENNVKLIVFPQLYLIGSPVGDILTRYPYVLNQCQNALEEIKNYCENISVLIGFPEINLNDFEKKPYNSLAFIKNKEIKKTIRKIFLNNSQEYCEIHCFEQAKNEIENHIIEIEGKKYGIIISDDKWQNDNKGKIEFFEKLALKVDAIISCDASCTRLNKEYLKNEYITKFAKKYNIKYIYVNQVGATDEVVYDGNSKIVDKQGNIQKIAKDFQEDFVVFDLENKEIIETKKIVFQKDFSLDYSHDLERTYKALVLSIKDYFSKNGFKKAVLGLSGGLDSTICSVLLVDALGKENVFGISMPSKLTSSESKNDAEELANNLGINFMEIPIKDIQDTLSIKFENVFNQVSNKWNDRYSQSFTQDNIQARSRAMILWGVANEYASTLSIATSDKSESYMGYATINGDMSGGYAPICGIVKTKLFALARWMNENREIKNAIPESIILKPPGAELAIDPKTGKTLLAEDALMPYEFMDEVIWRIENFNQSINDMMKSDFIYEKKNILSKETKELWLNKFFKRLNTALYKWYILPPGPIIDSYSINKAEFKQAIVSNINYSK